MYSDLPTAPKQNRTPWVDPKVRHRGKPTDPEVRALKAMLRDHPDRWALVKEVKTFPTDLIDWFSWGLLHEVRPQANGWWGVYVCFPSGVPLSTTQFAAVSMAVA
jgi:hypothetical protein